MTFSEFIVKDYYELLALHRALLESKFCDEPNDLDVSSSPIVAKLHKQLLSILVESDVDRKGDEAKEEWNEWLQLGTDRREWKVAIKRAKNEELWENWGPREKKTYVSDLLSPFVIDDKLIDEFIESV